MGEVPRFPDRPNQRSPGSWSGKVLRGIRERCFRLILKIGKLRIVLEKHLKTRIFKSEIVCWSDGPTYNWVNCGAALKYRPRRKAGVRRSTEDHRALGRHRTATVHHARVEGRNTAQPLSSCSNRKLGADWVGGPERPPRGDHPALGGSRVPAPGSRLHPD